MTEEQARPPIVKLTGISAGYGITAFSLGIAPGDRVILSGGTREGRSLILSLILGQERPAAGTIVFDGRDIWQDVRARKSLPVHFGFCFDGFGLISNMSVAENITLPVQYHHARGCTIADAEKLIARLGLEHVVRQRPMGISGEQRILAGIARAFVLKPAAVLFDYPDHLVTRPVRDAIYALLEGEETAFIAAGGFTRRGRAATWREAVIDSDLSGEGENE